MTQYQYPDGLPQNLWMPEPAPTPPLAPTLPPAPAPAPALTPTPASALPPAQTPAQPPLVPGEKTAAAERYHRACAPFLAPGEQVLYGAHLAVASAVEETPLNLRIDIRGQDHSGADAARALEDAALRIRQGVKAVTAPADLVRELIKDKVKDTVHEAVGHKLHGALFEGGWQSHAGFLLRYVRACREYGGPGASCAVTTQRLLVLRITQFDAPVLLVYAIPRGVIAGAQLRGTTVNSLFGRAPHAGLRFTDGSTLALDMTADQRGRFAASLGF